MKKCKFLTLALVALASAFLIASCDKKNEDDKNNGSDKATVKLMLTDAPAQYDAVLVDIREVVLHSETEGWISIPLENPGVYNLLEFSNGIDVFLGEAHFSSGVISQVRLVLGDQNSVIVDSVEHPLTVPSGSTSGIKLNVHENIEAGYAYTFWLDFDAAQSIHKTGNGKYMLKPVIRMFAASATGSVQGHVFPPFALPKVTLYNENDTVMALPDSTGYYKKCGIPEGTYSVKFTFHSETLLFETQSLVDVHIIAGKTLDLQSITLLPL